MDNDFRIVIPKELVLAFVAKASETPALNPTISTSHSPGVWLLWYKESSRIFVERVLKEYFVYAHSNTWNASVVSGVR